MFRGFIVCLAATFVVITWGGPSALLGLGATDANAQSLRSIVRRFTRPSSRKRKRTTKRSSDRRQSASAVQSLAPPAPSPANPRRLKHAASQRALAATSATAATVAATTAVSAKPAEPAKDKKAPDKAPEAKATQWSEVEIVDALRKCVKLLAPHDIDAKPALAIRSGRCGDPAPVLLKRIGQGAQAVTFKPAVTVNCAIAARFAEWLVKRAQPAAERTLGARIKRITGANGYACRNRYGARTGRLSEHALANAIDIPTFVLANGKRVSILNDWGKQVRARRDVAKRNPVAEKTTAPRGQQSGRQTKRAEAAVLVGPPRLPLRNPVRRGRTLAEARAIIKASYRPTAPLRVAPVKPRRIVTATPKAARPNKNLAFLKGLHKSACDMFGTVLGPEANRAHEDHFHFDLAPRRRSAYCR